MSARAVFAAFLAGGLALAQAQTPSDNSGYLSPEHRIASLQAGISPEVYGSRALFVHRSPEPTRYVALRFRGETELRVYGREMRRTGSVVTATLFVLTVDLASMSLPADGRLLYRMVADGLWMTDPDNPAQVFDSDTRLQWSVLQVKPREVKPLQSPEPLDNGLVRFHYLGQAGRHVALVGDFNGWDPFMHTLTEGSAGEYSIDLQMSRGPHFYMFLVDGEWTPDTLNTRRGLDPWGRRVCVVAPPPVALR